MLASTDQLLQLPPEQRRILIVLSDTMLETLEQHRGDDRLKRYLKRAAGGLGGATAGAAGGAAAGGAALAGGGAGVAAGAAGIAAAAASAPVVVPALAAGAVGVGVAALLTRGHSALPFGVAVVSATVARGLSFEEGPFELGSVYVAHPVTRGRYLPHHEHARILLQERARETESFLLWCGASRIEMTVEHGRDLSFGAGATHVDPRGSVTGKLRAKRKESTKRRTVLTAPGRTSTEPLDPSAWTWLGLEPEWPQLHRRRAEAGITG